MALGAPALPAQSLSWYARVSSLGVCTKVGTLHERAVEAFVKRQYWVC